MMPEKDGLEVLKEIKELDKGVPVAMITAFKDAERVIEAFRLGAMDCLLKPFNLDYIINNILPKIQVRSK
jgi:DNA-binding NtrC family response regulator